MHFKYVQFIVGQLYLNKAAKGEVLRELREKRKINQSRKTNTPNTHSSERAEKKRCKIHIYKIIKEHSLELKNTGLQTQSLITMNLNLKNLP